MAYRKVITWNARFQPVYRDLVVDRAIFRDYCSICGIILHWKREQELNHYGTKLERGVGGEGGHCRGMIQCCSKNSALQWATQVQKLKKGTWWLAKTLNGVKPSSSIATPPPQLVSKLMPGEGYDLVRCLDSSAPRRHAFPMLLCLISHTFLTFSVTVFNDDENWNVTELEPKRKTQAPSVPVLLIPKTYVQITERKWKRTKCLNSSKQLLPKLATDELTSFSSRARFWINIWAFCVIIRYRRSHIHPWGSEKPEISFV